MVSPEFPPDLQGGLGTHVAELIARLLERIKVDAVVPASEHRTLFHPALAMLPIEVDGARGYEGYWLRFCAEAVRQFRYGPQRSFDIVHCHDWLTVLAGIGLRALTHRPLVFSIHLPQVRDVNIDIENLGLAYADRVLVNSEAVKRELATRDVTSQIVVIPNGVDLNVFTPVRGAKAMSPTVLFVGRLTAQKGVDVLLQALVVLMDKVRDVHLVIAGDGDQFLYLRRLARHLGVPARVTFAGWQTGNDLVKLYQDAWAVAIPSMYEPFGIVSLEAMACARPVVASRTGGLSEVIEDGRSGYLVDPGDHLMLAQRLALLLTDRTRAKQMGAEARRRAEQYDWDRIAGLVSQEYDSVLSGPMAVPDRKAHRFVSALLRNAAEDSRPIAESLVRDL